MFCDYVATPPLFLCVVVDLARRRDLILLYTLYIPAQAGVYEFMCYLVHKVPGGNSGPESVPAQD
jgi:hypothetical protein